jgi:hypothetical protein
MSSTPLTNPEQPDDALAGKLKRTELQHSASSIPGREIVQVLSSAALMARPRHSYVDEFVTKLVSEMRANARPSRRAGPIVRPPRFRPEWPTTEAHRRALDRPDGLLRSEAGWICLPDLHRFDGDQHRAGTELPQGRRKLA